MRIFVTKSFDQFRKKQHITDSSLCEAVSRAESGLIDADLGGHVIKQRVAREGQGKSGGFRVIIVFVMGDKSFFVHGFLKSNQANLSKKEEAGLKRFAKLLLDLTGTELDEAIASEEIREVMDNA